LCAFPFLGPQAPKDTSFITFLFGSALATFGIEAKKNGNGNGNGNGTTPVNCPMLNKKKEE